MLQGKVWLPKHPSSQTTICHDELCPICRLGTSTEGPSKPDVQADDGQEGQEGNQQCAKSTEGGNTRA